MLDGPPPADLSQNLVSVADDDVRNQLDPVRCAAGEVEGAPPQTAFGALGRHTRQGRVVRCQNRGEALHTVRIGWKRLERNNRDRGLRFPHPALGCRVEQSNRLHRVVVEVEPNAGVAAGVEVDHPPANGELARLFHEIGAAVAGGGEPDCQVAGVDPVSDPHVEGAGLDHRRFRNRRSERARRHHHEIELVTREPGQEVHQPQTRRQGGLRAEVGSGHLSRNHPHSHPRGEQTECRRQVIRVGHVGHDNQGAFNRPPLGRGGGEDQCPGAGDHTADSQPLDPAIEVANERAEVGERILGHGDVDPIPYRVRNVQTFKR